MLNTSHLLAVIEVPHEDRVPCDAPGCGHSVYKRVHILRLDGVLRLYGSTCFARQFANQPLRSEKPHLTGSNSRVLSTEERALLAENAERLVAHLEADRITELKQQHEDAATANSLRRQISGRANKTAFTSNRPAQRRRVMFSPEDRAAVEQDALRILNAKFPGLDFYSAGFNGLLQLEIDSILRKKTV